MTAPVIPAIKQPYGRSAKELLSDAPTQTGAGGIPDGRLAFHDRYDGDVTLTALPAGFSIPAAAANKREWFDARPWTHVRLVADVVTPGAVGTAAVLEYCPDYAGAPGTWSAPGYLGAGTTLNVDTAGILKGAWVKMDPAVAGPRRDVPWRCGWSGGDGVTSPVIGKISAQFRYMPDLAFTKFYLRDGVPGVPSGTKLDPFLSLFALEGALKQYGYPQVDFAGDILPNLTVSGDLGSTALGTLYHKMGAATKTVMGSAVGLGAGVEGKGYLGSWVGPPIAGGQAIPTYPVSVAWKMGVSVLRAWVVWRIGIFRPGVGIVASWGTSDIRTYIPRQNYALHTYEYEELLDLGGGVALTEDGDRWIVGCALLVEGWASGDVQGGVLFNGSHEPVHFADGLGPTEGSASYISVPKLNLISENP